MFVSRHSAPKVGYLQAFETGSEARRGIGAWVDYFNRERPHSGIGGLTPIEAYATGSEDEKLAA